MSGEDALSEIGTLTKAPHIVLCDLGLPRMSGIDVTRNLKDFDKKIEIIIFTVFEDEDKVLRAIKAGAAGYILKGASALKIHEAILDVFHGGTVIQPTLARRLLKHFSMPLQGTPSTLIDAEKKALKTNEPSALLTVRELECLRNYRQGTEQQRSRSGFAAF